MQSSDEQYSAGLCETPSRHGTKIIDVGTTLLQNTLSLIGFLVSTCSLCNTIDVVKGYIENQNTKELGGLGGRTALLH